MSGKFGDRLMYIGGQFVPGSDGQWIDSVNPGTEEVHGRVPVGTVADVNRAVEAAEVAQPGWAALSVWERRDLPPGAGPDDPPLALTVTADGRPVVATAQSAWLGDPLGEGEGARWTSLWHVEPTRGDRLRLAVRRLHSGHWGLPLMPRLYDVAALLFVAVLATGVALAVRARRHHRKRHHS